jgi:hypothetical protein
MNYSNLTIKPTGVIIFVAFTKNKLYEYCGGGNWLCWFGNWDLFC